VTSASTRREDEPLLRGEGCFAGDLRIAGLLHAVVVRSPYARGRLDGPDLATARATSGVVDAFAAADVATWLAPIPSRLPLPPGLERLLQKPLALEEVRYAGQPIALVVGETAEAAREGAELVETGVDPFDPEPPVEIHEEAVAFGDLAACFERAEVVVRKQLSVARQGALPLEARGLVARFDAVAGAMTVWGASKVPHHHRDVLAAALRLEPERVVYQAVDAGGGFGLRGELHPEDVLVAIASLRTGRPVRWLEQRFEHLHSAYQSRGQEWDAAIAVGGDGAILALDARVRSDVGAFVGPNGLTPGRIAAKAFGGPYRLRAYRCHVSHVRTAKPPLGTMRGPGYFEASFVRERLVDVAATRLGADGVELRRLNLVAPAEMPYETGLAGVVFDGGDYAEALEQVVSAVGDRPAGGGRGVACVIEGTGTPGVETVKARRDRDGRITITLGSPSFGQRHASTFAGVAARALGVEPAAIDVVEGRTDAIAEGGGTFGSRTTVMTGSAVWDAANALREALEREPDGVAVEVEGRFECAAQTFTYGAATATVLVDPETGVVHVCRLAIAADAGVALEADVVRGQLVGGAAHGAGGALFESFRYADDGQPLTAGLHEYHVPHALDLPPIRTIVLETPSALNPLGVRGVGEVAVSAVAAAIANAVADAGYEISGLPLTPEAVFAGRGRDEASEPKV
jgi:CO/xanthine dehydrogenase Mo-binding subunit